MSNFFRNFPRTDYGFGDTVNFNDFQNLNVYVDIVDQFKDASTYYQRYSILENERPDQLSYKLYRNPNYGWTFYLLNDKIRESGWPMSRSKIYQLAKEYYPHITITTEANITEFGLREDLVTCAPLQGFRVTGSTGATGEIVRKRLDYGQIIVKPDPVRKGTSIRQDSSTSFGNTLEDGEGNIIAIFSQAEQYNSTHHWEDPDGNEVMIDLNDTAWSGIRNNTTKWIPFEVGGVEQWPGAENTIVTYEERLINKNDDLKEIKIFKPNAVGQLVGEFKRALRNI